MHFYINTLLDFFFLPKFLISLICACPTHEKLTFTITVSDVTVVAATSEIVWFVLFCFKSKIIDLCSSLMLPYSSSSCIYFTCRQTSFLLEQIIGSGKPLKYSNLPPSAFYIVLRSVLRIAHAFRTCKAHVIRIHHPGLFSGKLKTLLDSVVFWVLPGSCICSVGVILQFHYNREGQ